MAVIRVALALLALGARAHTAVVPDAPTVRADDVTLTLEPIITGGFNLVLTEDDERVIFGQIGRTLVSTYTLEDIEGGILVRIGNVNLTVFTQYDVASKARGIKFNWVADKNTRLEDCIDFGAKHWYGGPMQVDQVYPIETATQVYRPSYITEDDNGAIMERYWLNSAGEYIIVHEKVPLFVDYKNIVNNHICFGAQLAAPYTSNRPRNILAYDIWFLPNVKEAHKHAISHYLGKPSATPDYRMVQHPIWSTWAQYSREINESKLLDFAQQIIDNGFDNSQFEIDDQWETCYGTMEVNEEKFPDFKKTIQDIKALGYRVTIWAHPFINKNCDPLYSTALDRGYFVLDEAYETDTNWWNNNGSIAGYIDFTNPKAADWYHDRLKAVLDTYDIDSVKFDAGESSFAPEISIQTGDIELQPHHLVQEYAKVCARFGDMVEVRAGFRTQDLPIYVRMVDRDSIWGLNNGLSTIITTTLQMNLNGYPFVLPDMIGGNGYNLDHEQADLPTKELFIRWVQANTFLPVMQYSFAPWNFDEETVTISKKYTDLHAQYADVIFHAMETAVADGTPVNAPLWWIAPNDAEAFVIWDEYLLGESILVAPVLTEGARSRDIYLPAGTWYEEGDRERVVEGPTWLRNYPAPLDVLPYFIRDTTKIADSSVSLYTSVALVLLGLIANVINVM
ncbi:myogenesis-regulating glycosidase [Helicoverpa armigera]|uniref:myogenesis-regulating glycosidase n=1 Tax=Helicoverpa armigera TaxID=29058 RepID=UPI0030832F96